MVAIARVLVVEHDPAVREALERALRVRGYLVSSVALGTDALARLSNESFDLVVVELGPGDEGIELCRALKTVRGDDSPSVVFVTASAGSRAKVRALEAGADDFCVKPVDLDELDARLRVIVRWRSRASKLREDTQTFRRVALVDPLTDLANRRAFEAELERAWARLQRGGRTLALLVVDIDRFKAVNDEHGHRMGDEVIRVVARTIAGAVRKGDQAFRYGGEEFVILAPDAGHAGAASVGERVRAAVEATRVAPLADTLTRTPLSVTVSVGLAVAPDPSISSSHVLLEAADRALYEAKAGGRNRVATAPRVAFHGGPDV